MDDRTRVVRAGYDMIGTRFAEWSALAQGDPRERFLAELLGRLPSDARILELGCGARISVRRPAGVVGVDVSARQLERAGRASPEAALVQADMAGVEFRDRSFDGVVSLYAVAHVPRERHAGLFRRIASWLRPGGLFLANLTAGDDPGWTGEWLGVPMFFNGFDADTNRRLLRDAGFDLLVDEVVTEHEPGGDATFLWILARRP